MGTNSSVSISMSCCRCCAASHSQALAAMVATNRWRHWWWWAPWTRMPKLAGVNSRTCLLCQLSSLPAYTGTKIAPFFVDALFSRQSAWVAWSLAPNGAAPQRASRGQGHRVSR